MKPGLLSKIAFVGISFALSLASQGKGHFVGSVIAEWLVQDGVDRDMRLVEPFEYIDGAGRKWPVPKGTVVDGASIPQALWIFGSPYTGDYRRASVVHDHYCVVRTAGWHDVHRMFYEAAIADGLSEGHAKFMYAGIMLGGPRWELRTVKSLEGKDELTTVPIPMQRPDQREFDDLKEWIEKNRPTPDEIDREVERRLRPK